MPGPDRLVGEGEGHAWKTSIKGGGVIDDGVKGSSYGNVTGVGGCRQRCVMLMRHRKLRKSASPVRQFVIRVQQQPTGPQTTCMNPVCGSFFLRLISGNKETLECVILRW